VHNYDGAIWGPPSFSVPCSLMVHDAKWLANEFVAAVSEHGKQLQESLNHGPCMSAAAAITTMLTHWWAATPEGQMFSLGVSSTGII